MALWAKLISRGVALIRLALATLTDFCTTVSLEFRFNDADEITSVFTESRYREVGGKYESTQWEGRFRNYEERDGLRIPIEGEVEWKLEDGSFPYWKGRIVEVEYDFARKEKSDLPDDTRQQTRQRAASR